MKLKIMKILVTGNLGYIGTELGKNLKKLFSKKYFNRCSYGFILQCITSNGRLGDTYYD